MLTVKFNPSTLLRRGFWSADGKSNIRYNHNSPVQKWRTTHCHTSPKRRYLYEHSLERSVSRLNTVLGISVCFVFCLPVPKWTIPSLVKYTRNHVLLFARGKIIACLRGEHLRFSHTCKPTLQLKSRRQMSRESSTTRILTTQYAAFALPVTEGRRVRFLPRAADGTFSKNSVVYTSKASLM